MQGNLHRGWGYVKPFPCWHDPCSFANVTPPLLPHLPGKFAPVLQWSGLRPTLGAMRTWYEALSGAVTSLLPHDLFAAWLLPETGDPVLLGPADLTDDDIRLPVADPLIVMEGLFGLEDHVAAAGFRSAMAVPIRAGGRDVGLLLLGSLVADRYDRAALRTLHRVAADLGPSCGALAAHPWLRPVPVSEGDATGALLIGLLGAAERSRSPGDLLSLTSDILAEQLPHDRIEIITDLRQPEGWGVFSHFEDGVMADPGVVTMRRTEALVHHFGYQATIAIPDADAIGLGWPTRPARPRWGGGGAILATRLEAAGEWVGWLCVGSDSPAWFRPDDTATLTLAGRMLAPTIAAWKRKGR